MTTDPHSEAPPREAPTAKARPSRRHSMMLSVLASLLVVALVPVALMGFRVAETLEADLSAAQKEAQLTLSQRVADGLVAEIDGHFRRLAVLADGMALLRGEGRPDGASRDADLRRHLERYVERGGALDIRVIKAEDGAAPIHVHSPNFDPEPMAEQLEPEYAAAVQRSRRGLSHLGNPFLPASRTVPQLIAVVSLPLPARPGADRGPGQDVLAAAINLAPLQAVVQGASGEGASRVYVLDDRLRPVAHSQYLQVIDGADLSGSPLVAEFRRVGLASAASMVFRGADSRGREGEIIGTFRPASVQGRIWGVFVEVDREVGSYQVQAMRRTTLTSGLLAVVLAVAGGLVISLRVTRPVHELTESTRRIALGEYGKRVRVTSNDEIGMLADNFNLMSDSIRRTIDELQAQHEVNEHLFMASIRSLAAAIDARDPYTRGHSERVTRYARIIAKQLDLPSDQVHSIEIGALLHDVGKIGIEDRILRKPSALTPEEFEIMKTHPEKGGNIMEPIASLREATEVIIHHHERWDGTGYPSGLRGEEIPLGARVVSVADTFDAMTTNRPYQRSMTFSVAAQKIQTFAGKAADPRVVDAFMAALESGQFGPVDARPRAVER